MTQNITRTITTAAISCKVHYINESGEMISEHKVFYFPCEATFESAHKLIKNIMGAECLIEEVDIEHSTAKYSMPIDEFIVRAEKIVNESEDN